MLGKWPGARRGGSPRGRPSANAFVPSQCPKALAFVLKQAVYILAEIAERTQAATAALNSPGMPLCNLITIDIPWPHENFSVETGSDRSSDNHYAPMTWPEIEALGPKIPAATDCMMMVWTPRPLVVTASNLLTRWG